MTSISRVNGFIIFLAIAIGLFCGETPAFSADPLPPGLTIETDFKPGPGEPVGKVFLVQGQAVVIHKDKAAGYYAVKNLPLYKGDTLITMDKGRIRITLNDDSTLTLGSDTKLVINSSVYAPEAKTRFSLFKMMYGKARFVVRKITGFDKSDVSVKTKTAILGVRGSDFVVRATDTSTEVTALDNTMLEIRSLAAVEMKPTLLQDYEKVMIQLAALPSPIEKISETEKTELLRDLTVMPAVAAKDQKLDVRKKDTAKKDAQDQPTADDSGGSETPHEDTAGDAETADEDHGDAGTGEQTADDASETAEHMTDTVEDAADTVEDAADTSFSETDTAVEAAGIDADVEAATADLATSPDFTAPVPTDAGQIDTGNTQPDTQQVDTSTITDTVNDIRDDVAETVGPNELPQIPEPPSKTCP